MSNPGEEALNIVSLMLNSNSADLSPLVDATAELHFSKLAAVQPLSSTASSNIPVSSASPYASVLKPSKTT